MQKLNQEEKKLFNGAAKSRSKKGSNLTQYKSFQLGLGFEMLSSLISGITGMIAQDVYMNNPNPMYGPNEFSWSRSAIRVGSDAYHSSFSVLGGW